MLRVAEQYAGTDTGRQRRANEDSLLARSPLFVVADGMGGAQAGEVASRLAVESFQPGLDDAAAPEVALATLRPGSERAHPRAAPTPTPSRRAWAPRSPRCTSARTRSRSPTSGDSRAYCLRDGELLRLTDDHSLVDELLRQGRLTPEEAVEHPQRSVITRALGPELTVEVDTRSFHARGGDVYLLCSDGLTTMLSEEEIAELLRAHPRLRDAGEALIAAANEAGGRDNITVVLLRLEDVRAGDGLAVRGAGDADRACAREPDGQPPASARLAAARAQRPRATRRSRASARRRRRRRVTRSFGARSRCCAGARSAAVPTWRSQSVYFIGTNGRGLVTLFQGVPYSCPATSPCTAATTSRASAPRRSARAAGARCSTTRCARKPDAGALIRSLELGQLE